MSFPSSPRPVPGIVHRLAAGRPVRAVWANEMGGVTFRVGSGDSGTEFIKAIRQAGAPADFVDEARRLRWAGQFVTAPSVLDFGVDGDWSAAARLRSLTPAGRARLGEPPPTDRLVVCHGDACSPNTLIDDHGRCCGHVDFDFLGVADRWADLAVATLSLGWNYPGRSWDEEFFAAYGVEPDSPRLDYYRRLWQAEDPPPR